MIKKHQKKWLFLLFAIFFITIINYIANIYMITLPEKGGDMIEIEIGSTPRFINPVLANTTSSKDLVSLIYSPVLERNAEGKIISGIGDLFLSENKKEYTIKIKNEIYFSDGKALTADDVIFTIKKIQDPSLKSPYFGSWYGIKVQKIDEKNIKLILPEIFSQFNKILTKLYVLPEHLWKDLDSQNFPFSPLNINPIGSGPYKVKKILRNDIGKIEKLFLERNDDYYKGEVFIDDISFYFYDTMNDYLESSVYINKQKIKNIAGFSINQVDLLKKSVLDSELKSIVSPNFFGLFINKNKNKFLSTLENRKKLEQLIDKEKIISDIFLGHGTIIDSPFLYEKKENKLSKVEKNELKLKEKTKITISIINSDEFIRIAEILNKELIKFNIDLIIKTYTEKELLEDIIRNRKFELLLYGYHSGIDPDPFYLYHSSQASINGVNIANLRNKNVDANIIKLRRTFDESKKREILRLVDNEINKEKIFIPLYSPNFLYLTDSRVFNFSKKFLSTLEDRFINIKSVYIKTKKTFKK